MFEALKKKLNMLTLHTVKSCLLTTAVDGASKFIDDTKMDKVQTYLNFINIMTYDYQFDSLAIHHVKPNKFFTPIKTKRINIAVKSYNKTTISIEKLIMGIAFYGRGYRIKTIIKEINLTNKQIKDYGFTFIKDNLENNSNFIKR